MPTPAVGPKENPLVPDQFRKRGIHMADRVAEWLILFPGGDHDTHDKNALQSVPHPTHQIHILRSCLRLPLLCQGLRIL